MDSLLLMVPILTVVGAILLLSVAGFSLPTTSGLPLAESPAPPLRAAARLLCPHTDEVVAVELGLDESEPGTEIAVVDCEYFGEDDPHCGQRCLDWRPNVAA